MDRLLEISGMFKQPQELGAGAPAKGGRDGRLIIHYIMMSFNRVIFIDKK